MKKLLVGVLITGTLMSVAMGQTYLPEIQVEATRIFTTQLDRTSSTFPIRNISVSYGVSLADVDVSTEAGMQEAQKRVNDAALAACEQIAQKYPHASPDNATCAAEAAKKAMKQLDKRVQAAKAK